MLFLLLLLLLLLLLSLLLLLLFFVRTFSSCEDFVNLPHPNVSLSLSGIVCSAMMATKDHDILLP
jgi:hypothetical protein